MSRTALPSAAAGSSSTVVTDTVAPLLEPQHSSSSVGSAVNKDGEEEVWVWSLDQITLVSTKSSSKETWDSDKTLNILKTGNKYMYAEDPGID